MKDKLSALLDGDLDEHTSRVVLDAVCRDQRKRKDWDAYCLIGDTLRSEGQVSRDFISRVMAELDAEPTVLAPRTGTADGLRTGSQGQAAANEKRFWAAMMPVAASVMGVAAVGWVAHTLYAPQAGPDMMTVAGSNPPAATVRVAEMPQAPIVPVAAATDRDAMNRQYVFVHQATTGGGPIPGVVQYVRTVSDARGDGRQ